jgi:dienelactone hydrolase
LRSPQRSTLDTHLPRTGIRVRGFRWRMLLAGLLLLPIVAGSAPSSDAEPVSARFDGAPEGTYPVGERRFILGARGERPLPVTVWYPASTTSPATAGLPPTTTPTPRRDAPVAAGRFPVVIFSHGLHSLPEHHIALTVWWAAAGFVVAAPAYPHTRRGTARFDRADVRHQPGDVRRVLAYLGRLDATPADPFAGRLDLYRVGAAGHSAGGYTTAGLFTAGHAPTLRAGIVIAGGGLAGSAFGGPEAAMLFVHGDADRTVPPEIGWSAYRRLAWPKAFLTLLGQGHGEYLSPGRPGFDQVVETTTDFLRWRLYDDPEARERLATDAEQPGISRFVDALD